MRHKVYAAAIVGFFFGALFGIAAQPHSLLWLIWGALLSIMVAIAWTLRLRLEQRSDERERRPQLSHVRIPPTLWDQYVEDSQDQAS